ncbi:MAG: heparan-alpha-glucosaminide N-acetyltransferase [Burkholderiaceae bacterium]|nr:heparan-alpha-glucosaminide N-acetyltransferase [Burkholderiaceae bacterium]
MPESTAIGAERFDRLDALRGVAIVWMALFHFFFDLNHFGFIHQDFHGDPLWTAQRTAIVSLFVFCVGLGQAVARDRERGRSHWGGHFWQRWAQITTCALLVSAGSWLMFPRSYISFGVLHGIAVMLLLLRLTAPAGRWLWLIGLLALLMPMWVQHESFDSRWINWVGLVTHKPTTEDYVPLLPWLGVALWGQAAGQWALRHRRLLLSAPLSPALSPVGRPLASLGRWSLAFYMLHQPVLIGLVAGAAWLLRPAG